MWPESWVSGLSKIGLWLEKGWELLVYELARWQQADDKSERMNKAADGCLSWNIDNTKAFYIKIEEMQHNFDIHILFIYLIPSSINSPNSSKSGRVKM